MFGEYLYMRCQNRSDDSMSGDERREKEEGKKMRMRVSERKGDEGKENKNFTSHLNPIT
jgi:hypothetical protein